MQKWFKPPSLMKTNLVLARPGSTISPKLQLSSLLDQTKPLQVEVSLGNIFFIYQRGWLRISRSTNIEAKVKICIHGNGWAIKKLEWMLRDAFQKKKLPRRWQWNIQEGEGWKNHLFCFIKEGTYLYEGRGQNLFK